MFQKLSWFLCCFTASLQLFSQELHFQSAVLERERIISVNLPVNFDSEKAYPVIYVLDGDRIGNMVSSINDYLVTCERTMPAIIIGIYQDSLRWKDCGYRSKTSELTAFGEKFQLFLKEELIPYVDSHYKTTSYRGLLGHSFTGTYLYLTFLKGEIPFNSYIALSPYLPEDLQQKIIAKLKQEPNTPDFITATATSDLNGHKESISHFQKLLVKEKLDQKIRFYNFKDKSHLTLVPIGIEEGLNAIFSDYQPLSNRYLLSKKIPVIDKKMLLANNQRMEKKFGVTAKVRVEDIEFAIFTLSHHRLWDQLKELSEWTIEAFPDYYAGYYGMGTYYENQKLYDQSLEYFQKGYDKLGDDVLNKNDFYKDIERVRSKKRPVN